MQLESIKPKIPAQLYDILKREGITDLRPSQQKAVGAGLLERKSLLVCTPTASGKTLIAELAAVKSIIEKKGKAIYIVPLKALATEKHKEFQRKYGDILKVAITIGDLDSAEPRLAGKDLILCTSEKLDSLLRHNSPWVKELATIIVDEIHLLNDPGRGPTLEIILTMLKKILPNSQVIGLSATIGNPKELADWLGAALVEDDWRPVELKKGVYYDEGIEFV